MSLPKTFVLGAVAYDPKVVTIWDGFSAYFAGKELKFDYVLFSNYERQVEALFLGSIDVAWNSPLAWIQCQQVGAAVGRRPEAICMRDTDQDLKSVILVNAESSIRSISDLKGKRVAVGAEDSPQATLIPLNLLAEHGLMPSRDFEKIAFDVLHGKHGDHIGGERDAVRALVSGNADAACIIDSNHLLFIQEGTIQPRGTRVLAETTAYDHCNFTVLDTAPRDVVGLFRSLLLNMSYSDPQIRPLFDLEGLKQWKPGRTKGYGPLQAAVDRFGVVEPFVRSLAATCV